MPYSDPERRRANEKAYQSVRRARRQENREEYNRKTREAYVPTAFLSPDKREHRVNRHKEIGRKHYLVHQEEIKERARAYRQKHLDECREREKAYGNANAEKRYERTQAWAQAHPEAVRGSRIKYKVTHTKEAREIKHRRRAREYQAFVERVDPKSVYARDKGICGICKKKVDKVTYQLDHILPISRGGEHSYRNVQIAHALCNQRKNRYATIPQQLRLVG